VADAEKGGHTVDASSAADVMEALLDHGLHTFDMVRQEMYTINIDRMIHTHRDVYKAQAQA
jgi:hypothetical protein